MKRKSNWFLPVAVAATCAPCLLIPAASTLIAAGAFGGVLGFLGVPWVLALIVAVPAGAALLFLRLKRRRAAACCDIPAALDGVASRIPPS